jgi:nucleoside-triphosphatase THEP1
LFLGNECHCHCCGDITNKYNFVLPTVPIGRRAHEGRSPIVILTGESGSGKTTICTQVVALARARGFQVAGVLTSPRLTSGCKVGLDVEDIRTGECLPLAERVSAADGPAIGDWHFHRDGLAWGTMVLRGATPCDVLVIDEVGPLELVQGKGWTIGLNVLRAGRFRLALVVVRPALLSCLQEQLGGIKPLTLTVTGADHKVLPGKIISLVES